MYLPREVVVVAVVVVVVVVDAVVVALFTCVTSVWFATAAGIIRQLQITTAVAATSLRTAIIVDRQMTTTQRLAGVVQTLRYTLRLSWSADGHITAIWARHRGSSHDY